MTNKTNKIIDIQQVDGAWCKVTATDRKLFENALSYEYTWYKKGKFAKKPMHETGFLIDRRNNEFMLGLLPFVKNILRKKGYETRLLKSDIANIVTSVKLTDTPNVKDIIFRPDQLDLIRKAAKRKRGIIKSPTGSGKTILSMGLISMLPKGSKTLFLVHTIDLLDQTIEELKEKGFTKIQKIGGGGDTKVDPEALIVVSTNLSYVKLAKKDRGLDIYFTMVIVDEAHHAADLKNSYGTILKLSWAPFKIGFTATPPSLSQNKYKKLCLTALIGPVLGKLTVEEGIALGIIAKPLISLIPVPYENHIADLYKYKDIYKDGVVESLTRNKLILQQAKKRNDKSKTVLILIKQLEQGEVLSEMASSMNFPIRYINGSTIFNVRNEVKRLFSEKVIGTVVTTLWKEGINIPSLDCVINGCGGKGEIQTLQMLGRGLRRTELKKTVEIIDFLDPYRFLAQHAVMRLQTYSENGWLDFN